MTFNDREAAEAYLRDKNAQRMAGLDPAIVEMLSDRPPHAVAAWLDSHGEQYRKQAAGGVKVALTDQQQQVARGANLTDEQYIELVKKHTPAAYERMVAAQAAPIQQTAPPALSDEEKAMAKVMRLSEDAYLASREKLAGRPVPPKIEVTDQDRYAAEEAKAYGYSITPEDVAKRRQEGG